MMIAWKVMAKRLLNLNREDNGGGGLKDSGLRIFAGRTLNKEGATTPDHPIDYRTSKDV